MTTKIVGYVELEWTCPVCGTRNPGTRRTCASCGSPQPDDVKFEAPAQSELITDEATIAAAESGPDVHCPYCDARNPATAKVCKQCGGDLTGATARAAGTTVGAFSTAPAPDVACPACGTMNPASAKTCKNCGAPLVRAAPKPKAEPAPAKPMSRGCMVALGLAAILIVGGLIAMIVMSTSTSDTIGVVRGARWERSIAVLGLVPTTREDWWDEIPQGATVGQCRDEVRRTVDTPVEGATEVCGTPYTVDTGTGVGRVQQDCRYEIRERVCQYTVEEWRVVDTVVEQGDGLTPRWPTLNLAANQREGDRSEAIFCIFEADGAQYAYPLRSPTEAASCTEGARWTLGVNQFDKLISAEPLQ
jgi:rRNA maturation endonuclease Nob1